eukprot:755288-Hanusia_phi.AAC.2
MTNRIAQVPLPPGNFSSIADDTWLADYKDKLSLFVSVWCFLRRLQGGNDTSVEEEEEEIEIDKVDVDDDDDDDCEEKKQKLMKLLMTTMMMKMMKGRMMLEIN